ncbi:C80 family cysteine peptidase [Burkholderia ubonensis]|uniref:C80 family cysteine peptidase n=1 Tax=Burkholderia ubonensis TaxID=101571 RepID=UPI0012F93322|nr:C80 family cysteine peptidase [Burkholderia ubonensis]
MKAFSMQEGGARHLFGLAEGLGYPSKKIDDFYHIVSNKIGKAYADSDGLGYENFIIESAPFPGSMGQSAARQEYRVSADRNSRSVNSRDAVDIPVYLLDYYLKAHPNGFTFLIGGSGKREDVQIRIEFTKKYIRELKILSENIPSKFYDRRETRFYLEQFPTVDPLQSSVPLQKIDQTYDRQIVVEIGDGSPNGAVRQAAEFLHTKNQSTSLWVRWDGNKFVTVQGDAVPLTKMSRIVVVGHGNASNGALGGFSASELASKLATLEASSRMLVPSGVARVSLAACLGGGGYATIGAGVNYATDVLARLKELNKPANSITVRESLVQVDKNGRKWTKSLVGADKAWLQNDSGAKFTVYYDEDGSLRTKNTIADFDERRRNVISDVVSGPLGAVDEQAVLIQRKDELNLSSSDAKAIDNLKRYAEQLAGVSADDLKALRSRFPGLTEAQLIEKAAVDATLRSLKGNAQAEEAFKVGAWKSGDAERFLAARGILALSVDRQVINPDALRNLIGSGSALDHIRLVAAVRQLEPTLAAAIVTRLTESTDRSSRNLGKVLSPIEIGGAMPRAETVSTVGGDALGVFTTLTSVQQIITDWNQLSATQRGLNIAGTVGGLATLSPISKAISSAFSATGFALGEVGEAVKGSVISLALAPVTFASIGEQWKDFWQNGGDTNSLSYRSLVASTVITTVTTAASIALSAVSVAASLGAVAATSILGAVASAAGPIGVAIGAAAFLVNGIVQGAMQVAQFDRDFDNVGDKVEQFFASWAGVQTDGLQRAMVRQEARQDAERQQQSLTEQWAVTRQYLSDVFAKDGYSQLAVSDRTYAVTPGVVQVRDNTTGWNTYSYLLQSSTTYDKDIKYIRANSTEGGNSVWSQLGDKPNTVVTGTQNKRNLFNLDGETNLKAVNGGTQNDVFNLARDAKVETLSGGGGDDTLIWQAGNVKAPNSVVSVEIDTVTGKAKAHDDTGNPQGGKYLQQFSVSKIGNFSISATGNVVIRAEDKDNHLLEAKAARSDLYGGTGTNTFVLNNNTYAYSRSSDLFLWTAGANASIQLSPNSSRFTLPNGARIGDGSQKLPVNDAKQAAFIELPYAYADLRISRDGHALKLVAQNGATLTVDNMFELGGRMQKNKLLQLRDKNGRTFSLNLPEGLAGGTSSVSLADVPKAFVFRKAEVGERSASQPLHLHGDTAANSYNFDKATGYFVIDPQTTTYMTLVLDPGNGIQYNYASDGALTLTRQNADGILSLKIPNYSSVKGQLNFYSRLTLLNGDGGLPNPLSLVKLDLPVSGTGTLTARNTVGLEEYRGHGVPALPRDEAIIPNVSAKGPYNLSGSDLRHWVIGAAAAEGLSANIQDPKNLANLRQGNDLIVYDASKLDKTYGLSATTYLRIQDYFSQTKVKLNVNATAYVGTDKDDLIDLPATYTELLGGNGADRYRVDMTAGKTYTIDNMAADGARDTLLFHGVANVRDLSLSRRGTDLVLSNRTTTVVLKNYLQDAEHQHLSLSINDGDSFEYVIPVVATEGNLDFYQIDPQRAGQRVHIFNRDKTSVIDVGSGSGPNAVTVVLPEDVANYTKEVVGGDLKLVSADGKSTIYLANYYAYPASTSFAWNGQVQEIGTVLPDGWHQALLDAGVPREWLVRYVNAGVTTVSAAKTALAFQNDHYLKLITDQMEAKTQMNTANTLTAFVPITIPSYGNRAISRVFGNRESVGGTGFEFSINHAGDLILRANAVDDPYYNQTLARNFVTAGEQTSLLFAYDPRSRDLRIWKQGNNQPLYVRDLGGSFQQAWTQGTGFYTSAGSAGQLYIGNPTQISTTVGAAITTTGVGTLTAPTSGELAKDIYRIQGVPGLPDTAINYLVDAARLTTLTQINAVVTYLNRGLRDPAIVAALVGAGGTFSASTIDVNLINTLLTEKASVSFIVEAMREKLNLVDASLYLRAGVTAAELPIIGNLLSSGGTAPEAVMRKALLIQGYKSETAAQLAPILAETGLSTRTQVLEYLHAGTTDIAAVKRYVRAGVSVNELEAGNRNRGAYASGDRRKVVAVSVSDSLAQPVVSRRRYLNQDYTDSGGYTLKAGQLLEAGALANANYSLSTPSVTTVVEGTVNQFKGNSTLDNLVDGQVKAGDAWAWSWKSPTSADGKTETKLRLSNQSNPSNAGWIEFDLQDKIALTSIQLRGQGGDGTAINLKVQAKGASGQWNDVSSGSTWRPSGDSTLALNLNALDVPYDAYRLAFQQGDLPTNFWLEEVNFSTKALPLQPQAAALVQSMASFGAFANGGMPALALGTPSVSAGAVTQPQLLAGRVL